MFETLFSKYNSLIMGVANGIASLAAAYFTLMAVRHGYKWARSDDPHEKHEAKKGLVDMAIGAGIVGLATTIGNTLASHF